MKNLVFMARALHGLTLGGHTTSHDRFNDRAVRDGCHGDDGTRGHIRDLQWLVWRLGRLAAREAGRHPHQPLKVGGQWWEVLCGGVVWGGVVCGEEWCGEWCGEECEEEWCGEEWCGEEWCVEWCVEWCGEEWCVEWCGEEWCGYFPLNEPSIIVASTQSRSRNAIEIYCHYWECLLSLLGVLTVTIGSAYCHYWECLLSLLGVRCT